MAKCEKCGEEYSEGAEHVCSSQTTEKQEEQQKSAGEEATQESP